MAKAREIPDMRADLPYATAAAQVVAARAAELFEHSRGVLDTDDIERVHDMRVATRRLRAALEIFRPCFPRAEHRDALREVKAIADALGERRDRDVAVAALEGFAGALAAPDKPGITSLAAELRSEQVRANERLEPFVGQKRLGGLRELLDALVVAADPVAGAASDGSAPAGGGR